MTGTFRASDVLAQSAAAGDVEDLEAPTYGQYGNAAGARSRQQGEFKLVACILDLSETGVRLLAVTIGIHIRSPRKNETVESRHDGDRIDLVWERHR